MPVIDHGTAEPGMPAPGVGRSVEWLVASVVLALSAWVRLAALSRGGLWLDEILGVQGIGPEHGPVYYGLLRLGETVAPVELGARLPFALTGVGTVLLMYGLARACAGWPAAVLAATLLAASPAHVYYSRDARPYALLIAAGVLALWALVQGARDGWRPLSSGAFVVGLVLLALISANGIFYAGPLVGGALLALLVPPNARVRLRGFVALAALSLVLIALFRVIYPSVIGPAEQHTGPWQVPSGVVATTAQALVSGFDQPMPVQPAVWAWTVLAAGGLLVWLRRRPALAIAVALAAMVGLLAPIAVLTRAGHWVSARYTLAALAPWLLLVAMGLSGLVALVSSPVPRRWRTACVFTLTLALIAGIGWMQAPSIARARMERADWRRVAQFLQARTHDGDLIVASNDWTAVCLGFYLPRVGARARLENARESMDTARRLAAEQREAFLVAGGFHADTSVRGWMREHHTVLTSAIETISVSFYPDRAAYVASRLTPEESESDRRYFRDTLGGRLRFDGNSERFLLAGWGGPERNEHGVTFRWMSGRRGEVYLPGEAQPPASLVLDVMPFGPIAGRQSLTVRINGLPAHEETLVGGWSEVTVPVPTGVWRRGVNRVTFEASASDSPARLGGGDTRDLSICVSGLRAVP